MLVGSIDAMKKALPIEREFKRNPPTLKLADFWFDGGEPVTGWSTGEEWNGWGVPLFDEDQIEAAMVALRATGDLNATIRRVARCGGSASDLIEEAIRQKADVFVTADIRYHAFHHAAGKIMLVDAGHYETEYPVVRAMIGRLEEELHRRGEKISLRAVAFSTNPIRYM